MSGRPSPGYTLRAAHEERVRPGRVARSAWNRRAEAEREIVTLPHVISILQADLAHLTDVGRRWAPEGAAKAQAIENTRAKLAAAHAVIRTAEGRS